MAQEWSGLSFNQGTNHLIAGYASPYRCDLEQDTKPQMVSLAVSPDGHMAPCMVAPLISVAVIDDM